MKRLLLLALLAAACNGNPFLVGTGQFVSPMGIAATSARDRDLVFMGNSGHDTLRALQLCTIPYLPNGNQAPNDTCPLIEDAQFIAGPVRLFPGDVETGTHGTGSVPRPMRLAGVRLTRSTGEKTGAVLVVGADSTVRLVDALNLFQVSERETTDAGVPIPLATPVVLRLDAPGVDIVAQNPLDANRLETNAPPGGAVRAFLASAAQGTTPAELVVLDVSLDSNGLVQLPTVEKKCALTPVLPRQLVQVGLAGGDTAIFVADGAGDGAVKVLLSSMPGATSGTPPACTMTRIPAGGRSLRAIAASPYFKEPAGPTGVSPPPHPAGDILMMVLEPQEAVTPGMDLDPGGVLFVENSVISNGSRVPAAPFVMPVPPFRPDDNGPHPAMEPIAPTDGVVREGTFLRWLDSAGQPGGNPGCPILPCTSIYVGQPLSNPALNFALVAAITATDGSTYFIDVLQRRFINSNYYSQPSMLTPTFSSLPQYSPSTSSGVQPTLILTQPDTTVGHQNTGWANEGVTHLARWRAIWHSPFPELDRRSGTLTPTGRGTLLFTTPPQDLDRWTRNPVFKLSPGDVVSFASITPLDANPACAAIAALEASSPLRFELPIRAIPDAGSMELGELASTASVRGFQPDACPALGVVAEVRTAGANPWLVVENSTARGRLATNGTFIGYERRFDYPLDYPLPSDPTQPLLATQDIGIAFSIFGPEPVLPVSGFDFSLFSGQAPVVYRDITLTEGYATQVYSYASRRRPSLLFTAVTGSDAVEQADPAALTATIDGLVTYR